MGATLVWFRQDLRLADNPALHAAVREGEAVVPVYIAGESDRAEERPGAASRWWLHHSLAALDASLRERGSRLLLRRGRAEEVLPSLAREVAATALHWGRRYEPGESALARRVEEACRAAGIESTSHNAALLVEPWEALNHSGAGYRVFTAFKRSVLEHLAPPALLPAPRAVRAPARWPESLPLGSLELMPRIPWYTGMEGAWQPGEAGARERLRSFLRSGIGDYRVARERPGEPGTSSLSPHLHFGEIGPRQIWHALGTRFRGSQFVSELLWREFAYHLLHHFPHTVSEPLRPEFKRFAWRRDRRALEAWQRGRTGIPMVDAGMRQLWALGWLHNRVRMIVASFLVKNLLQPWQEGARWFWDTLVDADLANNTLGWQWVAGSGADAAPYFRVFNPVTQGTRFDPEGSYVRRWIPELAKLPDSVIHAPWTASASVLAKAGVELGKTYPTPIVDLARSRVAALEAYEAMRKGGT